MFDFDKRLAYISNMQRFQGFKYELMPTTAQMQKMRCFTGSCRFVFNRALAEQKDRHERGEKKLSYNELSGMLTAWRRNPDTAWLAETPAQSLQSALKDLEWAYTNFFSKRAGFPRFKKKSHGGGFRFPQRYKLDEASSRILLPKLGWVRYRNSRKILGKITNVVVSSACGKWFVSIFTKMDAGQAIPATTKTVGVDLGIARFATLSDGTFYMPLNSAKRHADALRKAQQAMSRKVKLGNNWQKARARVRRIYARIRNCRRDYLHKISTAICKNHAVVCIEDLRIRDMIKASPHLSAAILDQGWFEFRKQLEYKQEWNGGRVVVVPSQYTSRTCPSCQYVAAENRQSQASFVCGACGFTENADLVGAINILRAGHAQLACEVNGAAMPSAAGTRRSGTTQRNVEFTAVGIPTNYGREDAKD